ncbi:hypothetical protein [Francisella tularensis]|nr:hypothetical protein [Francisella tularensis]
MKKTDITIINANVIMNSSAYAYITVASKGDYSPFSDYNIKDN